MASFSTETTGHVQVAHSLLLGDLVPTVCEQNNLEQFCSQDLFSQGTAPINLISCQNEIQDQNNDILDLHTQMNTEEFARRVLNVTPEVPQESETSEDEADTNYIPCQDEECDTSESDISIPDEQPVLTDGEAVPDHDQTTSTYVDSPDTLSSTGRSTARKRARNEAEWKQQVRKWRRNQGKEYITRKGKTVQRVSLAPLNPCSCQRQCNKLIKDECRQELFSNF